jgi:prepilin-type N-terminal cleavage/methylation domain-containing protein
MKPVRAGTQGFTILELLIAMVIGLVLLTGVYGVLINQSREYLLHRENIDVQETLRGAAVLLTSEIEHSSAVRDLVTIGASTLKIRSIQNAGVFCVDATPRYGVWLPSGLIGTGTDDSAFVRRVTDGAWVHTKVTNVWVNPGGGAPAATSCPTPKWNPAGTPTRVVELAYNPVGDSVGVRVGSAIRGFRMTTYSLTSSGGRWWLGRQIGTGTVDLITGPLQAGGLTFTYYDTDGVVTATPANVVSIKVTLTAESFRKVRGPVGALNNRADDVTFTAYLRN